MDFPAVNVHDTCTLIGGIAWTAMAFYYPSIMDHMGGMLYPTGLVTIAGGQALAKGGQRRLQGGSVAPNVITPPVEAADGHS